MFDVGHCTTFFGRKTLFVLFFRYKMTALRPKLVIIIQNGGIVGPGTACLMDCLGKNHQMLIAK